MCAFHPIMMGLPNHDGSPLEQDGDRVCLTSLAEKKIPKLRDVFISALNEYLTNLPSLKKGVKISFIKHRLIGHSEKALGEGAVSDVLLQGVFEAD